MEQPGVGALAVSPDGDLARVGAVNMPKTAAIDRTVRRVLKHFRARACDRCGRESQIDLLHQFDQGSIRKLVERGYVGREIPRLGQRMPHDARRPIAVSRPCASAPTGGRSISSSRRPGSGWRIAKGCAERRLPWPSADQNPCSCSVPTG